MSSFGDWLGLGGGTAGGAAAGSAFGPWGLVLGGLIGSGLSFYGQSEANKINKNAFQDRFNFLTQHGISPLAASGVSASSPGAQNVFQDAGQMGQNIGRALDSQRSAPDAARQLALENASLQNELLRNDVTMGQYRLAHMRVSMMAAGTPPRTSVVPENQFYGGQGDKYAAVPMYEPMYLPGVGAVPFPTRDASTRSFGTLGEPYSRWIGDYTSVQNALEALQHRRQNVMTDDFTEGPFALPEISVNPWRGKYQGRYPYED